MDPYIGEIRIFAGNFAPRGWMLCDGSLLRIVEYRALFEVIGFTYGGGVDKFALPDLRGRAPMHCGEGPGLTPRLIGQAGGRASVTMVPDEMPVHFHTTKCLAGPSDKKSPIEAVWSNSTEGRVPPNIYADNCDTYMSAQAVGSTGGNAPHSNMQPYLGINYVIATEGW